VADIKTAYVSFFSGIGGWDLGAYWAGARFDEHYYSEIHPYASKVFQQRFPDAIPLGDITKLNESNFNKDTRYVFSGSFPCQDLSVCGKGEGLYGSKSSLWFEFLRLIGVCKPAVVLVENVAALSIRGLDVVIAGLAQEGYSASWRVISAADVGAPHLRKRMWIIAYPSSTPCARVSRSRLMTDNPMSFYLNRKINTVTGLSTLMIDSRPYFDYYFVGCTEMRSVIWQGQSVAHKMPLGGCLVSNGEVYTVPAWEGGLLVNEILEDSDDNNGRINFEKGSGETDKWGDSCVRGELSVSFAGAGTGYEDVADASCSRREGHALFEEELSVRGGSVRRDKRYSELEGAWDVKPGVQCMVNGVPWYVGSKGEVPFPVTLEKEVDSINTMLTCYGNALVPQIAWILWRRVKPLIPECYVG